MATANSAVAQEVDAGTTVGVVFGVIGGLLVLVIVAVALAVIAFIVVKKQQDANKSSSSSDDDGAVDVSLEMGSMASASALASFGGGGAKIDDTTVKVGLNPMQRAADFGIGGSDGDKKTTSRFVGGNPMSAKEDFGIGVEADDEIMGGAKIDDTTVKVGSNPMQRAADFGIGGASLHSSDSVSLSAADEGVAAPAVQQASTEKKSRPMSMRADVDGMKYSKEEFVAHYGGSSEWNQAKRTSGGGGETAVSARPVSMREESFTDALAGFDDEGDGDNVEKKAARPVSIRTSTVREESFDNALAGFGDEDDGDHITLRSTGQLAPVVENEPTFSPLSAPPAGKDDSGLEYVF